MPTGQPPGRSRNLYRDASLVELSITSSIARSAPRGGILTNRRPVTRGLVGLDVSLLNNRGERFALLAGEVCKGLAGKAGELDCKGIEAFAYIRLLADGLQLRSQFVENDFRHADRGNPSEPGLHLEAL